MRKFVVRSLALAGLRFAVWVPALAACGPTAEAGSATGSAEITLTLGEALDLAPTDRLDVTVTGAGITTPMTVTLAKTATAYAGTLGYIPPGTGRTFAALLYDANGVVTFGGQATGVTIEVGRTASVQLVLQQTPVPASVSNWAPAITSLSASALKAAPGATISLGATATDADGDALTVRWSATDGTFADATVWTPVWTAGAASSASPQTITVAVTDSHGATVRAPIKILPVP